VNPGFASRWRTECRISVNIVYLQQGAGGCVGNAIGEGVTPREVPQSG